MTVIIPFFFLLSKLLDNGFPFTKLDDSRLVIFKSEVKEEALVSSS